MKFTSLSSSSRGNAYLLEAEGVQPLLLEAGIPIKQLREKLYPIGLSLSDFTGCLCSHEHSDHSKAVKDLLKAGVDCYMSLGTARMMGLIDDQGQAHHRLQVLLDNPGRIIFQGWDILTFYLQHDAAEPLGFFIGHKNERLLFIPDTEFIENRFEGVNILVIECNHAADILSDNIAKGLPAVVGRRTRRNHLELDVVKDFILANNMQKTLREIHLIHLSDGNSDEARFKKEIQEITGVPVYISEA